MEAGFGAIAILLIVDGVEVLQINPDECLVKSKVNVGLRADGYQEFRNLSGLPTPPIQAPLKGTYIRTRGINLRISRLSTNSISELILTQTEVEFRGISVVENTIRADLVEMSLACDWGTLPFAETLDVMINMSKNERTALLSLLHTSVILRRPGLAFQALGPLSPQRRGPAEHFVFRDCTHNIDSCSDVLQSLSILKDPYSISP
jgi:hypothetical protein